MSATLLGTQAPIRLAGLSALTAVVLPSGTAAAVRELNARDYAIRRQMMAAPTDSEEAEARLLELAGRVLVRPGGEPFDAKALDEELGVMTSPQLGAVLAVSAGRADVVMAAIEAFTRAAHSEAHAGERTGGEGNPETPATSAAPESDSTPTPSS